MRRKVKGEPLELLKMTPFSFPVHVHIVGGVSEVTNTKDLVDVNLPTVDPLHSGQFAPRQKEPERSEYVSPQLRRYSAALWTQV